MFNKYILISKRIIALVSADVLIILFSPYFFLKVPWADLLGKKWCDYFNLIFDYTSLPYSTLFGILSVLIFMFGLYLSGFYNFQQDFRNKESIFKLFISNFISATVLIFISYMIRMEIHSRWAYFYFCLLLSIGNFIIRYIYSVIGSVRLYSKKVIVLGCGKSGKKIAKCLLKHEHSWLSPIAIIEKNSGKDEKSIDGIPVILQKKSLIATVKDLHPDLIIVAMRRKQFLKITSELIQCAQNGIEIWDVPTTFERLEGKVPLDYVDEPWLFYAALNGPKQYVWRIKRLSDIVFSVLGLLVALPLLILAGFAVYLESGRPIIIRQERIGKNGRIFLLYKIRTMDQIKPGINDCGTIENDCRVTKVGKILRKYHLDEFPQFINVLKGEQTLIGPRAELFEFVHHYVGQKDKLKYLNMENVNNCEKNNEIDSRIRRYIPYIEQRFTVLQGITGWAQVNSPYVSSSYEDMIKKLEYDLYYIKNVSLILDLNIFLKTIKILFFGRGK